MKIIIIAIARNMVINISCNCLLIFLLSFFFRVVWIFVFLFCMWRCFLREHFKVAFKEESHVKRDGYPVYDDR